MASIYKRGKVWWIKYREALTHFMEDRYKDRQRDTFPGLAIGAGIGRDASLGLDRLFSQHQRHRLSAGRSGVKNLNQEGWRFSPKVQKVKTGFQIRSRQQ